MERLEAVQVPIIQSLLPLLRALLAEKDAAAKGTHRVNRAETILLVGAGTGGPGPWNVAGLRQKPGDLQKWGHFPR